MSEDFDKLFEQTINYPNGHLSDPSLSNAERQNLEESISRLQNLSEQYKRIVGLNQTLLESDEGLIKSETTIVVSTS